MMLGPGEGEEFVIGPTAVRAKATDAESGGSLFVAEHAMPASFAGPPAHVHDAMDHAFYVLEGRARFAVGEQESVVGAGGFVFVPRGTPHTFGNPGDGLARLLEINVPGGFEFYYRALATAFPPGIPIDLERVREIQTEHGIRPYRSG